MATDVDLDQARANAIATYETRFWEMFDKDLPGSWSMYTQKINAPNGIVELHHFAAYPIMRQWAGARQEKSLRNYNERLEAVPYELTVPLKRTTLTRDPDGVGRAIDVLVNRAARAHDQQVTTKLDSASGAGPTGFDGVALFNAAHPNVNSGAGHSNLAASTNLSHANFSAGRAAMIKFKDETGEPMDITPTHARCGPDLEQRYKEILEATDRVVALDMSASETTTAVQDVTTITNVWRGELTLIVDPRMGSAYHWDIYDLSQPNVKPMVLVEERAPIPVHQDQMTDSRRFFFDEFLFGVEADFTVGAGHWATAYRGTGTA